MAGSGQRTAGRRVIVFDSNALNPYGAELAAVLRDRGYSVIRWCRLGDPFSGDGIVRRRALWASRSQVGLIRSAASRYWGPVLFTLLTAARRRDFVIFPWPDNRLELKLILLLARIGVPLAYVDHNPLTARPLPRRDERLLQLLRQSAAVRIVHSEALADQLSPRPYVAPHPSYRRWVEHYAAIAGSSPPRRALFLGRLREDKGVNQLPGIIDRLLDRDVQVLIAGRGSLPSPVRKDPRLHLIGGERTLSDQEVADAIRTSSVLIAPYRDVTMSGTILMALTAGLPVAAYDAPTLRGVLPDEFLVYPDDVDDLAERAIKLAESRQEWAAHMSSLPGKMDAACAHGWANILDASQGSRP